MPKLKNHRHEIYAQARAKGRTRAQAIADAGYKYLATSDDGTPRANTHRIEGRPEVRARIAELQAKGAAKAEITIARVLEELARIGFANMADYVRIVGEGEPAVDLSKLTREQAAAIAEVVVEDFTAGRGEEARDVRRVRFKLHDKRAALVDIGRHLKMFTDKVEHSGNISLEGILSEIDGKTRGVPTQTNGHDRSSAGAGEPAE